MTRVFKFKLTFTFATIAMAVFIGLFYHATQANAELITPIYKVLSPAGGFTGTGRVVTNIWGYLMAACNSFVFIMLIAVAFMNILRIQLDSYAVKKILPSFIMAVILANFSFLICRVIIDFGNIAISIFLMGSKAGDITNPASAVNTIPGAFDTLLQKGPPSPGSEANYYGATASYIFKQLLIIVGAVFVYALAFIMLVRNYFLYMLVAISPVAFLSMFLPMTKKYFQQWWGQFTKWVFMPVTSVFWIWFGGILIEELSKTTGEGSWLLTSIAAIFCFYMAVTSALKFDKAVATFGGFGKNLWNKTGGAAWNATGGAGIKAGKQYVNDQYGNVKKTAKNWALDKNLAFSGSISKASRVGQLRQKMKNAYFDDKDKVRNQEAFLSYIGGDEFRRPDKNGNVGFKKPLMAKLKGQARELFVDDEWNREVYNGFKNKNLLDNIPRVLDPSTGAIRNATLEDIANTNLTLLKRDGVTTHGSNSDRIKAAKESGAAIKELLQRRKGAKNQPDDLLSLDPVSRMKPNDIIEQEGLNVDPRIMASSAVPDQSNFRPSPIPGTAGQPEPAAAGAGAGGGPSAPRESLSGEEMDEMMNNANWRSSNSQGQTNSSSAVTGTGNPPLQTPPGTSGPAGREILGDVRRRQRGEASAREAQQSQNESEAGEEGSGSGNGNRRSPDMARVEELLEGILSATEKQGVNTEQMAANISKTASGPNVGLGIASIPEIHGRFTLENLAPQAKAELGILQDRANQRASVIRQRLETKQAEQQLRALRTIDENGEAIKMEAELGMKELEIGSSLEEK